MCGVCTNGRDAQCLHQCLISPLSFASILQSVCCKVPSMQAAMQALKKQGSQSVVIKSAAHKCIQIVFTEGLFIFAVDGLNIYLSHFVGAHHQEHSRNEGMYGPQHCTFPWC